MTRATLPARRPSEVVSFDLDRASYHGCVGYHPQTGEPMEIFLDAGKPGSPAAAVARDAAVVVSLALQHGCPLDALRAAVTRAEDGSAAGPIGMMLDAIVSKELRR